jgi:precorrin-8X/cobalt-precorrin-8 methylmutase
MGDNALIHELYINPMSGEAIEAKSFEIIEKEASDHDLNGQQWQVVRRMIHTTADFNLIRDVKFSSDAIDSGVAALKSCSPIYVDSNMIRSGLSLARLRQACADYDSDRLYCHVADQDVAAKAKESALPRSLFAVRKAQSILDDGIAIFGNAPVALMELNRFIMEEGIRPALIVAMPVGFVHVVESKEELMSLHVPYIALAGRRGGSPLAVSVVHALCSLATQQ